MEANPYAPPQVTELSAPRPEHAEAEAIRQAHIKVEATVKSVGVLYYLGAFLVLLASVSLFSIPMRRGEGAAGVVPMLLVVVVIGIAQGVVAYGLRRLRSWARWPAVVLSCIGLLGFPIGTIINGYILSNLLGAKPSMVFSERYQEIIAATPHVKYKTSRGLIILLVVLLVILLIAVGAATLMN
jgi:hypothetical protein